ncbi:hypothetical protein BU17DRAFT_61356 [Hysterangium stoloniferum]|nr:hypothetical protein BU17DRAFT_61356 [Hysterangium stoloniferum]
MSSSAHHHRRRPSDPFRDNQHYDRNGPRSAPLPTTPKEDLSSAIKDSVTVRSPTDPRAKMSRSHTAGTTTNPTPPRSRRSHSADGTATPPPVDKSGKPPRPKTTKKASMHADIIDRLDFSGLGHTMLHHDGPFDACAPSRNKNKNKAPMLAWSPSDALSDIPDFASGSPYDGPYGAASMFPGSANSITSMPKKRVDALAEAWGIAEPEPFEEFSAGGGDRINIDEPIATPSPRRSKEGRDTYRDKMDGNNRAQRTRSILPPPQPISLPGTRRHDTGASSPNDKYEFPINSNGSGGSPRDPSPRRSRSLIARIRQMRDAPNVPITYDEDAEPSEHSDSLEGSASPSTSAPPSRPTHKHQTSFLGRFRASGGAMTSPTSEKSADFVYADEKDASKEKDLPPPPGDYFGDAGSRGIGRKPSLIKRIKGGVRNRNNSKA